MTIEYGRTTPGQQRAHEARLEIQESRVLFVIGAPRSGTTWIQLLLAQHPLVATKPETQLFAHYLVRLDDRWQHEQRQRSAARKVSGLSEVLSETEFYTLFRGFSEPLFDIIRAANPHATVVVEKSPDHARHTDLILKVFPEAWFLHIIRDPRAVANSFRHAAKTWWTWTPSGPIEATRRWQVTVEEGRRTAGLTFRYLEVRYEALHTDGAGKLEEIFRWIGLPADRSLCEQAIEACRIEHLRAPVETTAKPWSLESEPPGFFRKGEAEGWRTEMPRAHVRIVEYVAGDLLDELGYDRLFGSTRRRPSRVMIYSAVKRFRRLLRYVAEGMDWRLREMLKKL